MKILALTNLYPPHYLGGYELIAYAVLNNLKRRGHEVVVLTSNHVVAGKENQQDKQIERTLRINGFYGHSWVGMPQLIEHEASNNKILLSALKRHQPDLVYVWNMGGLSKSMVLTLQRCGVPTVFYLSDHWIARGFDSDVWLQWWNSEKASRGKKLIRSLFQATGIRALLHRLAPTNPPRHVRFPRLYFCSKALRKLTASAGFDVMHGAIIYAPVNTKMFQGEVKPASAPLRKLLWVGRLAQDKGIFTALKAMALVKGKFPGDLHIYGKGEPAYEAELKRFAAEHNLPVTFSAADMKQMPEIYRQHDALLFTSEWAEPFALTPLEAMSSGLPVIGTTTGGSREIFRHGDNSLTYTAGNSEELAERIFQLSSDDERRVRIAQAGQAEVRARCAEDIIVDQIETYLKETVEIWTRPTLPHYKA